MYDGDGSAKSLYEYLGLPIDRNYGYSNGNGDFVNPVHFMDFNKDLFNGIPGFLTMSMYTPKRIWQTPGGYTTVEWMDGTKTTVKAENEESATEFGGFVADLAKKIFGSTSNVNREIQKAKEKAEEPAKLRKARAEFEKIAKQNAHNRRIRVREREIKKMMDEERMRKEALKRLAKEEEESK